MQQLQPGMARIRIKDLRLRTYIGIKEEEINNRQDVVINATILYPADNAVEINQIEHALNYRTITKAIISHVESNRFAPLERLTQEVLDIVMDNEQVRYAEVEVDEPHALRFSASVSITLSAPRCEATHDADCRALQIPPGPSRAPLRRHPGVHRAALPLPAQRLSQRAAVQQRGAEPGLLPPAGDGSGSRAGYPAGPAVLCRALSGGAG